MLGRANGRPSRREVEPAALALLARHGAQILTTARRYSATPEDAEDAYQRAFEILLTKAPSTSEKDLVPWLKTVVKHEAFAIRRQRERSAPVSDDGELAEPPASGAPTHDRAERFERLRLGAEALHRLKPQEVRCLVLRAEGYSYKEICELTGWTYTKVNRCLTEGRRAFLRRVAGIEAGSECERLAPALSALADGEISGEALRGLRPHLKTCLACRARLKEYRAAPKRVAALLPPAALASSGDGGPVRGLLESLLGAAQHKAAALGERAHAAAELATGQKVAAVTASAAALAGGGAGVKELAAPDRLPERPAAAKVRPVGDEGAAPAPSPAPAPAPPAPPASSPPPPSPSPAPPPADPANEFAPGAAAAASPQPARSSRGASGGGSSGGGEFGP
jgi:RNA polymerase sigma factor (sigma-70 family)